MEFPEYLIESSHGAGRFRFAYSRENVKNSVRGILLQYPQASVQVFEIVTLSEVSSQFLRNEE